MSGCARIDAVALLVDDYDRAIAFFTDALGFTLLEDTPLAETGKDGCPKRWVRVQPAGGGTALLLARAANDQERAAVGRQGGGRVMFFLHSEHFAHDHARMTAAGVHFRESPRDEPYGRVAVFEDCCGNAWDLIGRA